MLSTWSKPPIFATSCFEMERPRHFRRTCTLPLPCCSLCQQLKGALLSLFGNADPGVRDCKAQDDRVMRVRSGSHLQLHTSLFSKLMALLTKLTRASTGARDLRGQDLASVLKGCRPAPGPFL